MTSKEEITAIEKVELEAKKREERTKLLAHTIKTGVDLKLKQQAAATAITCNIDNAKEQLGCTPTYLRKLIDLEFNKTYDPEKFEKDFSLLEEVVTHFEHSDFT